MKVLRLLSRSSRSYALPRPSPCLSLSSRVSPRLVQPQYVAGCKAFSSAGYKYKGLQPDSSDPKPPNPESHESAPSKLEPAQLEDDEYHDIAENYLNTLLLSLEDMADKDPGKGLEVEYSAGVLTITLPKGTYVLNKQPPNKQIWLSSPISGPKRYDWVLQGGTLASQHEKQDSEGSTGALGDDGILGGGKWIYLRDGSQLTDILAEEVGVEIMHEQPQSDPAARPGVSVPHEGTEG